MSLRARLLLGMGAIALVLVLAGAVIARATERHLVSQVDDQLRDAGPALNALPRGDQPGYGGPPDGGTQAPRLSRLYVGRITTDGALVTLYAPDLSGEEGSAPALTAGDITALRSGDAITARTENGDADYRVLARDDRRRGGGLTVAALPLDDAQESVRRLVAVELLAGAAVLGVLGLVSWWVIHLGVRPVRRMTEAASAIAAGDLSRRVPEGTSGTESAELGAALNQMLSRIEDAFEERTETEARLRRFLADASHELRTPVATIRGYAELYRTGALSGGELLADAMRRTEQEAVRMGDLIDELLQLARLDQGRAPDPVPVDLATLAADAALDAQATAPDRTVITEIEPATVVQGDEGRLRQVVSNLVGNALVHAPDSPIRLTVRTDGGSAVLEVADDGPGMDPTDAGRAFERFYRADASRQRHRGGSGLGLAIVEATVRAHGGTVALDTAPGEGTTVRVTLPLAPP